MLISPYNEPTVCCVCRCSTKAPLTTNQRFAACADVAQRRPEQGGLKSSLGIFATGVVHGCNPDALFVIIPALTLPTKLAAMTYTLMFVLGTVGAMGGYTAIIGTSCLLRCTAHLTRWWLNDSRKRCACCACLVTNVLQHSGFPVTSTMFFQSFVLGTYITLHV